MQSIANLDGGQNCEVQWTLPDHPTIDVTATEGDGGGGGGGGEMPDAVVSMTAGSNNSKASLDATYQDYLTYETDDGQSTTIPLPYINAVHDMDVRTDSSTGDKELRWNYTRNDLSGSEDLGVEFTDATGQNSTQVHSKFKLRSASNSNVQFSFNGREIYCGVYYI